MTIIHPGVLVRAAQYAVYAMSGNTPRPVRLMQADYIHKFRLFDLSSEQQSNYSALAEVFERMSDEAASFTYDQTPDRVAADHVLDRMTRADSNDVPYLVYYKRLPALVLGDEAMAVVLTGHDRADQDHQPYPTTWRFHNMAQATANYSLLDSVLSRL